MTPPPPFHADSLLAHASSLRALARALSWDDATADDLVQETWLTAMEKKPHAGEGLRAWLQVVMRRRFAHKQRAESARRAREHSVAASETVTPVEDRKSVVSALSNELMQLDEPYQTTLFLRFFEERSVLEIARHYDTTTGTVGSRIHRGLELLRKRLDARSHGKRESWLGALAPFANTKVQGVVMSGNTKIGVAAATLCALVFFISQAGETQPLRATLETPSNAELAAVDEARPETELAAAERIADAPPPVVAVAPPEVAEEVAEPANEAIPDELLPVPEPQWPPAKNLWTPKKHKIKRTFKLSFKFRPADADASLILDNGMTAGSAIDWTYSHTLNTTDTISSAAPNADFERTMIPKWKSRLELLSKANGNEWVEHGRVKPKQMSPFSKRTLLFHYDKDGHWQASLERPRRQDPIDLCADLMADMNFTDFRPPVEIQLNSVWTIKDEPLRNLLQPAGDLRVDIKNRKRNSNPVETPEWAPSTLLTFDNPDGVLDLTCIHTNAHTEHVNGALVERLVTAHTFAAELEVSFSTPTAFGPDELRPAGIESFEQRLELRAIGTGTWDTEAEFISGIKLEGTAVIVREMQFLGSERNVLRYPGTFELEITNKRSPGGRRQE